MMLEILLSAAIRTSLVGAAIWLSLRVFRVHNPHTESLSWRLLLLSGLILPALLYWRLAPSFPTPVQLPMITVAGSGDGLLSSAATRWGTVATAAMTIYLGVAVLLLARLAAGLAVLWRISRQARPLQTPDDVRISARITSPATFGSTILLPTGAGGWPAQKLDAVLAHERMHVRGRDAHWCWLARFHTALFWFNPLAWWVQRRLEVLAEITSDDAVVAARHDPVAYAALLLEFARQPNSRSLVMSVADSNVSVRIERLLARTPPAARPSRAARWATLAVMLPAVILAASTTRATSQAGPGTAAIASAPAPAPGKVSIVKAADPDSFYPEVAKNERVTGYAVVRVSLDPVGQLVDVAVVEVQPADPRYGFADAAMEVARSTQY
ncbi:MAG TPA: M56 family metallopeptidase, partial [Steroidobacteraceae bacterium]